MRKVAGFLMMTADGFHGGLSPWAIDWHRADDEFNTHAVAQLDASDGLIFGATPIVLLTYKPQTQ